MTNKNLIIVLAILGGLVLLVGGFYTGVLIQTQKAAPQLEKATKLQNILLSKLIYNPGFYTYGKVQNILDRKITLVSLTQEEESLEIPISQDAKISVYIFSKNQEEGKPVVPEEKEISFEEIKIGDRANIIITIKSSGELEGTNVRIVP